MKFVDKGALITPCGISACINRAFHLVAELCGEQIAIKTAKRTKNDI